MIGEVGAAMRAKLINNLLAVVHIGLAYRALRLGQSLGIDEGALRRALMTGTGRSFAIELVDRLQCPDKAGHVRALLEKDVGLALDVAPPHERQEWQRLADAGLRALDRLGSEPAPFTFDKETAHANQCKG